MKTVFYIFLLVFPFHLFAQDKLNGMVSDGQGKPLDAATVTLSLNGQVISSLLADQGKFMLTGLKQGGYQLSVTLIGYKPLRRTFSFPKDSLKLTMQNDNTQLKEVAITSHTPTVEHKIDRVVFNVENSIVASGGNVWEALSKAPGVQANSDGGITAGRKGVTVYIDDKPVQLAGEDLSSYLQSLPASSISKIEVMTNPPSKYDAQGGAVINIITKKMKAQGFNANLTTGYTRGAKNRYSESAVLNYRKDKLNIFGSYGYAQRNSERTLSSYTIFRTPDSYSDWDRYRLGISKNTVNNYKAGADYNLTDNQVVGVLVTGSNGVNSGLASTGTNVFNNYRPLADSVLQTNNLTHGHTNQYSFNLNYKIKLDTAGKSLNVDVDYVPYRDMNVQDVANYAYLQSGNQASAPYLFSTPASQNINIWSGKLDYESKLWKKWTLESGLKYTNIVSENQFSFFNTGGATPVLDQIRSDHFQYTERTAAAYGSISRDLGKWSFKGGLRAEYTTTKGNSLSLDSTNQNKYLRLFPTAFVTYKASADNEFGLNYSRRIGRPTYWQLNPAKSYSTPYNYQSGNPFLRPAIFNSAELTYTFHQQYTFGINYNILTDLASNVTVQDNVNKTFYDTQQNIGTIHDTGIEFTAVNHPASWWEINSTAEGSYRTQKSDYLGGTYNYQNFSYHLRSTNAFTIDKNIGLKAEISGWYDSGGQQGILSVRRTYDLSAGISKTVLNKQGTIRFSAADILYTNPYTIAVNYQNQQNGLYQRNDTRAFALSFSYKLGKNIAAARKRSTAAEEEKLRTN